MSDKKPFKASKPTKSFTLQERSDVDPHDGFKPEELGMEDWGDGFFVNPEPVVIERNEDSSIKRITPISEATPSQLEPKVWKDGQIVEAEAVQKPSAAKQRPKETVVQLLAGLLMRYYSEMGPNQLPYNPLYDGIPAKEALHDDWVFQPEKKNAELVHVSATEVHEWLKKVIGKRADVMNLKQGKHGYTSDLSDLTVRLKR